MIPARTIVAGVVAVLAVGCSGGGGTDGPATPSLTVSPTGWSVAAGGAPKQFTASLTGSSDAVVWSLETAETAAEVGTVSSTGLYTPPPSLAIGRDVVVKATAGALVARATVHVGAAVDGVTIAVTPPTGTVVAGSGQTVALHAETNAVGTISWALAPDLGTIDASTGVDVTYTAPAGLVTETTDVAVTATAGAVADGTTITVHPTVLQVTGAATVHAGGAPVVFTVAADIGVSTVTWSVTPSSVGTIAGSGSAGTFTPAATVAADTAFQVVATIGEATGSASSTLLPPAAGPATVAGTVTDERGIGVVGVKVIIGAQSTTTGANGTFTIPSVTPPYDVAVIADAGKTVSVFRGVSDPAPVLWFIAFHGPSRSAQVSGNVSYGDQPLLGASVFGTYGSVRADGTTGDYAFGSGSFPFIWTGEASTTLTLRAIAVGLDQTTYRPSGVYAFGSRPIAVADGGTLTGQDLATALATSGHVTGTMVPDGELNLLAAALSLGAVFSDGTVFGLWDTRPSLQDWIDGTFDLSVPTLPSSRVHVRLGASGFSGGRAHAQVDVGPGDTGVALVLPLLPVAMAPADKASGVGYGTSLAWTNDNAGGTSSVHVDCDGGLSFRIHGGGTAATIPDLSAHGVTLAPGTSCTWYPDWDAYGLSDLVNGPAAVEALGLDRGAHGPTRSFTF